MFTYAQPPQKQEPQKMTQPASTGIPAAMKTQFEHMSGLSLNDVRIHYHSGKPAQLQALAYTQGSDVYVAPGQERHLGHELGHIIQQRLSRVPATARLGSVPLNDDPALEAQADHYAHVAAQGGTLPLQPQQSPDSGAGGGVVQRCGLFDPDLYSFYDSSDEEITFPWHSGPFDPKNYDFARDAEISYKANALIQQEQIKKGRSLSPSEILRITLVKDGRVSDPHTKGISNQAHHIVETSNRYGQQILADLEIDPNSSVNGVFLPNKETDKTRDATTHLGRHAREYTDCVNYSLHTAIERAEQMRVRPRQAVINRLCKIRNVLLTKFVPLNKSSDATYGETIHSIFQQNGLFN